MRRPLGKAGEWAVKVAGLFAVLEPVWMLLPFAGFLYGSVFNIHLISGLRVVSRLAHFVFPVHTLFPAGLVLTGLGAVVFLAGAGQIYYTKLAKKGLVTGGLYRFARHPQYTALVLFGAGALLAWGRLIAWIAFAGMMCLYYFLAREEERDCAEAFGDDYRAYAARTPFAFPGRQVRTAAVPALPAGDRRLEKLVPARLPRWARVCAVLFRDLRGILTTEPAVLYFRDEVLEPGLVLITPPGDEKPYVDVDKIHTPDWEQIPAQYQRTARRFFGGEGK